MTEPLSNEVSVEKLVLGIEGFNYHDLFQPEKLHLLHTRFSESLVDSDPEVGRQYSEILKKGSPNREDETWVAINVGPPLIALPRHYVWAGKQPAKTRSGNPFIGQCFVREEGLRA